MKFRLITVVAIFSLIVACTKDQIYIDTPIDQLLTAYPLIKQQERKRTLAHPVMYRMLDSDQAAHKELPTEELVLVPTVKIVQNWLLIVNMNWMYKG